MTADRQQDAEQFVTRFIEAIAMAPHSNTWLLEYEGMRAELSRRLARLSVVEAENARLTAENEQWRFRFLRYAKCSSGCALNRSVGIHHCTCGFVSLMDKVCAFVSPPPGSPPNG